MNNGLQYSNRKYWNILICKKSSGSKHKTIQKGQRLVAHFLFSNTFPSLGCFLSTSVSLYFSINQKEIHRRDLEVSVVEPKLTFISPYPYVNLRRVRSIKSCQLWCAWRVSKKKWNRYETTRHGPCGIESHFLVRVRGQFSAQYSMHYIFIYAYFISNEPSAFRFATFPTGLASLLKRLSYSICAYFFDRPDRTPFSTNWEKINTKNVTILIWVKHKLLMHRSTSKHICRLTLTLLAADAK